MNNENSLNPETDGGVRAPLRREPERKFYAFAEITPWARNPRGAELRGIPEFAEQIVADGGIKEDLHVFWLNGVVTLMAGHRRHAAGQVAGLTGAWCKDYGPLEEGEAFMLLLSLQQGNDPFDARELARAAGEAVDELGIPVEVLAGAMHRSMDRLQLFLDLRVMPGRVQDYVFDGRMTLGTVSVLRQVAAKEDQLAASTRIVQGALGDGQSMGEGQAIAFIRQEYLLPVQWRKDWDLLQVKLKKKYPVADGHQYVEFEERAVYVQGDVGLPERDYRRAEEYIEPRLLAGGAVSVTWGDLAQRLKVGIFVVAAPNHKDGYVRVVMPQAVEDAESCLPEGERVLKGRKKGKLSGGLAAGEEGELSDGGAVAEPLLSDGLAEGDCPQCVGLGIERNGGICLRCSGSGVLDEQRLNGPQGPSATVQPSPTSSIDETVLREVMGTVVDVLAARPEAAMKNKPWLPLVPLMFEMAQRSGMLPPGTVLELRGVCEVHKIQNRPMRWPLTLLLLALAVKAEENGEGSVEEQELHAVLEGLGVVI